MKKKVAIITLIASLFTASVSSNLAEASTGTSFKVSPGVDYKHEVHNQNQVRVLETNLQDPYTKVEMVVPGPLDRLMPTTSRANATNVDGHRVVGAINAGFFEMNSRSTAYKMPLYLVAENNVIHNAGVVSTDRHFYVNEPIAFGMTKDGKAKIDHFTFDTYVTRGSTTFNVSGMNRERQSEEIIVFTPQNRYSTTKSNEYGLEFVVELPQNVTKTTFNMKLQGTVKAIRPYGSKIDTPIPANGVVVSFSSAWYQKVKDIKVGETMTIGTEIDSQWQDAQYMMASGPLLVKDGKVNISMDTTSSRAREKTARTAVAISKDGNKVFLVTTDRGTNSAGMSLPEFAAYLAKLGVDRALNLDGGGSTTMGVRSYGSNINYLINRPSNTNGAQRSVSTILQAVSTASQSEPARLSAKRSNAGTLTVGDTVTITPSYVLDKFYNSIAMDASKWKLTSEKGLVSFTGLSYKALKAGTDTVTLSYGNAKQTFAVTIQAPPSVISPFTDITDSYVYVNELRYLYDKGFITGDIDGTFKASNNLSRQHAAVMLARAFKLDLTTIQDPGFDDVPTTHRYYREIAAAANAGFIKGDSGKFNPSNQLTRGQMAAILVRAFDYPLDDSWTFEDVSEKHGFRTEISTLAVQNVTTGFENGTLFKPSEPLIRAHFALFLYRALTQ